MKYIDFHKLCLNTLIVNQNGFFDMRQVICSGTHIRVHAPSMEYSLKRYFEKYNNLKPNETNSHGIIVDRFVTPYKVEYRYAQDNWDSFETTYHEVSYEAPKALKILMAKYFPEVRLDVLSQIYKMHLDKKIETNTFNPQGGEKFQFTYKSFKEIYTILLQEKILTFDYSIFK